jgi:hypothetical protein
MTQRRRWMAAVLACGNGAALSHRSAAALWGLGAEKPGRIDISVKRRCNLSQPGLVVRSRPTLAERDLVTNNRVPVTAVARTLVDLATELTSLGVERAVNEADKRDLIDPETLRGTLDRYEGEPGVKPLRALLDKRTFKLSDSDLEIFFRPIAAAAGLSSPLTKQIVNGFEVDFFWPDLGLVVETDGLRYHRTPAAQARDARRDRTHVIAGMTPLRFTHHEIRHERHQVRRALRSAAELVRARKQL